MDLVLNFFDDNLGDSLYSTIPLSTSTNLCTYLTSTTSSLISQQSCTSFLPSLPLVRDSLVRQSISLYFLTYIGILFLYFGFATLSYYTMFDHRMMTHPRFLPNQIKQEIKVSWDSFAPVSLMTLPWFLGDVRGGSKLYGTMKEGPGGEGLMGWLYMGLCTGLFLVFTDAAIYWVHRGLHHPLVYKRLHKPHHRFIIPTPFASHAFHPLDGYLNSLPYHIFIYMVPVHKQLFLALFVCVNLWTIFIHDSDLITDSPLENYINGPSHHTLHHLHFTVNYGQYFTYADKFAGSFRVPLKSDDPLLVVLELEKLNKSKTAGREEGIRGRGRGEESEESEGEMSSGASDSGFEENEAAVLVEGRLKVE